MERGRRDEGGEEGGEEVTARRKRKWTCRHCQRETRVAPCSHCGGVLHTAHSPTVTMWVTPEDVQELVDAGATKEGWG